MTDKFYTRSETTPESISCWNPFFSHTFDQMQSVASARWTSQPSIARQGSSSKQRAVVCPSFSVIRKGTQLSVRKPVSVSATAGTAVPSRFDTLPEVPEESEACVRYSNHFLFLASPSGLLQWVSGSIGISRVHPVLCTRLAINLVGAG